MAQIAIDGPVRVQPERGGLLDVANVIETVPAGLLYHGFKYASANCGKNRVIPAEGEDKVPDQNGETEGVLFGAYRLVEGPLLVNRDGVKEAAVTAFNNSESYGVERGVQTELLNDLAVDITPTPGTPITNPRHALGLLEQHAADNYAGLPLIHGNKLAVLLIPELRVSDDFRLHTVHGTPISNGGGYGTVGPGAANATAGRAWLYITGQVNVWRGPLNVYPDIDGAAYGLKENRSYALVERKYGVSVECDYVAAVLVSI